MTTTAKEFIFTPAKDLTANFTVDINDLFKSGSGDLYNMQKVSAMTIQCFVSNIAGRDGEDSMKLVRSNLYDDITTVDTEAITGITQVTKTITIDNDHTNDLFVDDKIVVSGSTGNDGIYTVVSATLNAGDTDIVVAEALPDATVDGDVDITILNYVEVSGGDIRLDNGTYGFDFNQAIYSNSKYYGLSYTASAISAGTLDKVIITLKFD